MKQKIKIRNIVLIHSPRTVDYRRGTLRCHMTGREAKHAATKTKQLTARFVLDEVVGHSAHIRSPTCGELEVRSPPDSHTQRAVKGRVPTI